METTPTAEALRATRRAVGRIRSYGIDGPRPIEEIEALMEQDAEVGDALRAVLLEAGRDDLVAAIHLVVLLRRAEVLETVREVAFERPASLAAKREAVEALRSCGADVDAEVAGRVQAIDRFAAGPEAGALAEILGWPEAWREPALDEWLTAAGPEQLDEVGSVLGGDPARDRTLLDWLGAQASEAAAEILGNYLTSTSDRRQLKYGKRALHRMRSTGFDVEDPTATADGDGFSMALEAPSLDDARAFVTSIDGRGARLVWILWRSAGGGSRLLQAVVDDRSGLREAEIANVTRKGFRDYVEQMRASPAVLLDQVEVDRAIDVLEAGARLAETKSGELPPAYVHWLELIDLSSRPDAGSTSARIYELVDVDLVRGDGALLDAAMKLLREPHFQSWAMEGACIAKAAEQVQSAETSTLMVSDEQRRERMEEAIRDAVETSFDEATRQLYRRRLEIMAAVMWERGQQDSARQALAAAVGLTEIRDLFREHAFARAIVHRGVWLAYQDRRRDLEAEEQRSRIVRP